MGHRGELAIQVEISNDEPNIVAYAKASEEEFDIEHMKDLYLEAICESESHDQGSIIYRAYHADKMGDIPTWLNEEPAWEA